MAITTGTSSDGILVEHARAGARYWAVDEALVVAAVLIGESTFHERLARDLISCSLLCLGR